MMNEQQQENPHGNLPAIAGRPKQHAQQQERNINAALQYTSQFLWQPSKKFSSSWWRMEEWEEVTQLNTQNFPAMQHSSDFIKHKFQALTVWRSQQKILSFYQKLGMPSSYETISSPSVR
jgi:hypothetical protein